ncbi:MAG: formyl transferase [Niastella sp.]|nr:formyl transferase [Niastella sp.]
MENKKILLLAGKHQATNIVFHYLQKYFTGIDVILEEKENTKKFLQRRIRRLGWGKVIGQMAFQVCIAKPMSLFSQKRVAEILKENGMDDSPIPAADVHAVHSVNHAETISLIKKINPDLVIVNGTRIISKKVIQAADCKMINTHAGITPKYRGVHGMYWALVNRDIENSGVTVHYIDEGIDTGNIIYQENVLPTAQDNFITYPMLQLAAGLPLLKKAVEDYFKNEIQIKESKTQSALWYHPTIWSYCYNRIFKKVK